MGERMDARAAGDMGGVGRNGGHIPPTLPWFTYSKKKKKERKRNPGYYPYSFRFGVHRLNKFSGGSKMQPTRPGSSVFLDVVMEDGYKLFHFGDSVNSQKKHSLIEGAWVLPHKVGTHSLACA